MQRSKQIEISVGLFMLVTFASFLFLVFKVGGTNRFARQPTYSIYAEFDDIGDIKLNAPVKLGGVIIGRVSEVTLDPKGLLPKLTLKIFKRYSSIPKASKLAVRTSGLLGERYLAFTLNFAEGSQSVLVEGDSVPDTQPPIILEDLISRFFYKS